MARRVRFKLTLILILLVAGLSASAERAQDLPLPTNWVSDFAQVLSPQTIQSIDNLCQQVSTQAKAQIVVVTIKTLDGVPIEDFATDLEDKWKVGKNGADRSAILIFAIQDHKRWIETGYGLEGILPDAKVGDIGREMVPYLKRADYDGAVSLGVSEIAQVVATDAGVTLSAQPRTVRVVQPHPPPSLAHLIITGIVFLVVILFLLRAGGGGIIGFLLGMFLGGGGRGFGGGGGGFGGGGGGGGFDGLGGGSSGGGGAGGDW